MDQTEKLSISLPASLARLVREKVKTGAYASNSEVIRDALRAWQKRQMEHTATMASIKARIDESINDPRPSIPAERVFDEMRKRYAMPAKTKRRAK